MSKTKKAAGLLTTQQAADRAGVCRQTIHDWIKLGRPIKDARRKLRAQEFYGRLLVDPADLAAWLKEVGRDG